MEKSQKNLEKLVAAADVKKGLLLSYDNDKSADTF